MTRKHSKVIKIVFVWVAAFASPVIFLRLLGLFYPSGPNDFCGALFMGIVALLVAFVIFMLALPVAITITVSLLRPAQINNHKLTPLIAYISTYKKQFSQNQIIAELLRAGWTQTQIVEAWKLSK